ncbi:MAG: response regulator [Chloroflexi bacterium]|nr:response regulator [Chloroflexota bacterium]
MSGERILVVDDSAQMRDFMANVVLQGEGYRVDTARNGTEGLAAALASPPDLIITDLSMPDMSGLEMLQALREQGSRVPAILMTAEGSEDLAVQALRLGVMDYFIKPFDPEAMVEAVSRVLQASRIGSVRTGVPDQRRLQALNTLIAVGKSITSLLDVEQILSRVVEAAVYLSEAEEGVLMLVDPETGDLYVRAEKNLTDGLRNMRLRVQDSLAGQVIRTGEPLLVSGEGMQQIKTRYLVRSLLYVPLKIKDRVLGVLGLHNRASDRTFSREDVALMIALADYAAITIVNAHLYTTAENERARLARIFSQAEDAMLAVDEHDRIVLCNPAAEQLLEALPEGVNPIGRPLREFTRNESLLALFDGARLQELVQGEVELEDERTYNARVVTVENIGRVAVMHDITYLKERDRVKTELLEMVSHQVRSPLTAILSYIELLMRTGDLNEQQLEFAGQVRHNVRLITETIRDLLDLGKIEAGLDREREPVSLHEVAAYAVDALRDRALNRNQTLVYEGGDPTAMVLGNPVRLRQVFVNLIDNAIKYTPTGGKIYVELFGEGEQVIARVTDTGIGIPLEDQPRIFDKFYRAGDVADSYDGTGLGLSIVKSIVEAHGGRIWLDSRVGRGTTFTIVRPGYDPQVEPVAARPRQGARRG